MCVCVCVCSEESQVRAPPTYANLHTHTPANTTRTLDSNARLLERLERFLGDAVFDVVHHLKRDGSASRSNHALGGRHQLGADAVTRLFVFVGKKSVRGGLREQENVK